MAWNPMFAFCSVSKKRAWIVIHSTFQTFEYITFLKYVSQSTLLDITSSTIWSCLLSHFCFFFFFSLSFFSSFTRFLKAWTTQNGDKYKYKDEVFQGPNHWPARYRFQLSRRDRDFTSLSCGSRSRFLPPYHVVRDRDRDFYLSIMWFEIEIFHHWISCFETRSRFFIIESRSSRRDREFSSLNLEVRDEIDMLFISFVNKFQTPEQRAENDISLKKMCIQR